MSVSGQFSLHYSWGCSGPYATTTVTFSGSGTIGTFVTGDGFSGKWSQTNGNVLWRYNGDSAIYSGVVNGGAIVGNMANFAASNHGCFYCSKPTASLVGEAAAGAAEQEHDSAGEKKKK